MLQHPLNPGARPACFIAGLLQGFAGFRGQDGGEVFLMALQQRAELRNNLQAVCQRAFRPLRLPLFQQCKFIGEIPGSIVAKLFYSSCRSRVNNFHCL